MNFLSVDWRAAGSLDSDSEDELVPTGGRRQGWRMSGFRTSAAGIEETQKSANDPISGCNSKGKGSCYRKQEQRGQQKRRHKHPSARQRVIQSDVATLPRVDAFRC